MPASCTFRLNRLRTHSNESPGFTIISVMKITSAIAGRSCDQYVAIGNIHCNTRVCHRVAERGPASPSHSSHRWRYTFGLHHVRETHPYFRQMNPSAHDPTAFVRPGTLDSGSAHSSVPVSHKTPSNQQ